MRLKVGIVSEPPRVSSCLSLILSQALSLKQKGHDVSVLIQKRNFDRLVPFYDEIRQIPIQFLSSIPVLSALASRPWSAWIQQVGPTYDWISTIDIASVLSHGLASRFWFPRLELDAVICHTTYSPLAIFAWYGGSSRTKRVLYLHDWPISYFLRGKNRRPSRISGLIKEYESLVVRKSHQVTCLTATLSKVWKEMFDVDPKVAYPGCHPSPKYYDNRGQFILSVWRWEDDTRPFFLIDLMNAIKDTTLNLVIVGPWHDSSVQRRFEEQVAKSKLSNRISILNKIPWSQLLQLYRTARCIVYPAWNSFGYAGLEAASQGSPLVAPKGSGLWEMFSSGQDGYSVENGDLDGYAEAIRRLESDQVSRRLGHHIWQHSLSYDWKNHAHRLEEILAS